MTRSFRTQAVALALAAAVTLGMLGAINGYATAEPSPQLLAQVQPSPKV